MRPRRSDRSSWRRRALGLAVTVVGFGAPGTLLVAQQETVATTLHNLSASGPGEIRAVSETEVCKFCHIPHNAQVAEPLWSRPLSEAQYLTPNVRDTSGRRSQAPQPDGSSRLCLSCHDGTIALGEIVGESQPLAMAGAERLSAGHKGYIGTDLSGDHPISFSLLDANLQDAKPDSDIAIRSPSAIVSEGQVPLDAQGKMQCTTCHDPHADRYYVPDLVPRFWIRPTVDEVCLSCHALR
ncbi:MAG: cytochrome c3 family protein [Thermoanaerobaculia bacterium]